MAWPNARHDDRASDTGTCRKASHEAQGKGLQLDKQAQAQVRECACTLEAIYSSSYV
jgi:hypothetical protein